MWKYIVLIVVSNVILRGDRPNADDYGRQSLMELLNVRYQWETMEIRVEFDKKEDAVVYLNGLTKPPNFPTITRIISAKLDSTFVEIESDSSSTRKREE